MVKNCKAQGLSLAPLSDEHVYAGVPRKTLVSKTPAQILPMSTTPLSVSDSLGAIWAIDDTHHGRMELELLIEFGIWCPDGLNISEFRQATGLTNTTLGERKATASLSPSYAPSAAILPAPPPALSVSRALKDTATTPPAPPVPFILGALKASPVLPAPPPAPFLFGAPKDTPASPAHSAFRALKTPVSPAISYVPFMF